VFKKIAAETWPQRTAAPQLLFLRFHFQFSVKRKKKKGLLSPSYDIPICAGSYAEIKTWEETALLGVFKFISQVIARFGQSWKVC
jgi:hypothetical protein